MKVENQKVIFKILKPVVEFLKEKGVDAQPSVFRCNYGAIRYDEISEKVKMELYNFLWDKKDCQIFSFVDDKFGNYILFSFVINGKWGHAYE